MMCDVPENVKTIKCMIVGDSLTGKTYLFRKLTSQAITSEYVPTVFDVCNVEVATNKGHRLKLNLWDSAGSNIYDTIRPISYAHTDCFIICYSVNSTESLENVYERWLPEIKKHGDGPTVPIILVATKCDLDEHILQNEASGRGSLENGKFLPLSQGKSMKEKIGAKVFFPCSVSKDVGINDILQSAIDLAYIKKEEEETPSDPVWKFSSPTVVFTGDSRVGKTSLITACSKGTPNPLKIQSGEGNNVNFQEYYHNVVMDGCEYFIRFVEMPCQTNYLSTAMDQVDVLVLCYAIDDPFSFQTVQSILLQSKFQDLLKRIPVLLIGTKSDLQLESVCVIPTNDGELLKKRIGCISFMECSAKTSENVSKVFGAIIDSVKDQ